MNSKHSTTLDSLKILYINDIITSIYLPLILAFLYHNSLILKFGKYENIYVIIIIASGELLKYLIYSTKTRAAHKKNSTKDIFKTLLVLSLLFVIFHVLAVLFGAPIFSNVEETAMFSLLLTTLTALPSCLHLGPDTTVNMLLSLTHYEGDDIAQLFLTKLRLALFGAWLGAVPIPLDWNRPWQEWPITCCSGAFLGYIAGNLVTIFLHLRKTLKPGKKTGKFV